MGELKNSNGILVVGNFFAKSMATDAKYLLKYSAKYLFTMRFPPLLLRPLPINLYISANIFLEFDLKLLNYYKNKFLYFF